MEHTNRTIRPLTQQDLEAYLDIYLNAYPPIKRWTKRAGSTTGRSTVWSCGRTARCRRWACLKGTYSLPP